MCSPFTACVAGVLRLSFSLSPLPAEFTDLHYGFSGVTSERLGGRKDKPSHFITSQITYFASSAFATCAVPHVSEHSTTISVLLTFGFPRDLSRFSLISSAKPAVIVPARKDLLLLRAEQSPLCKTTCSYFIHTPITHINPYATYLASPRNSSGFCWLLSHNQRQVNLLTAPGAAKWT